MKISCVDVRGKGRGGQEGKPQRLEKGKWKEQREEGRGGGVRPGDAGEEEEEERTFPHERSR